MVMLLVYLGIALGFSFLCSVLEAVLLSITPGYIIARREEGSTFGKQLEALKADIDRPLAAILTLNTFAHTIGAAGVGAEAQKIWGSESLAVVSAVVTILILIGSEIIPKTIGAVYWARLVRPAVFIMRLLIILLLPFVWISQLLTKVFRRGHEGSLLSRNDIRNVVNVGFRSGVLHHNEKLIMENLINLNVVTVADIMTPREVVLALDQRTAIGSLGERDRCWYVSRIPIYDGELDRITGYVLKDEILAAQLDGRGTEPLTILRRPLGQVAPDLPMPQLYRELVGKSEHMTAVVEEGRLVGLVTMEDLIESMFGLDIRDEGDERVDLKAQARAIWQRRARHSGIFQPIDEDEQPGAKEKPST